MDLTNRSPLLDLFRRGEGPHDVRLLAAQGALASTPLEQLDLLVLMAGDEDEQVAATARETIDGLGRDDVARFLARPDVTDDTRAFFRARGIEAAEMPGDAQVTAPSADDSEGVVPNGQHESEDRDRQGTAQRLAQMPVSERVKRAMLGSREERFILIRDTNRLIAAAVLSSPKTTQSDVESFARMGNVSEDVLRTIGNSRGWAKCYPIAAALALNPKTPVAISLGLVSRLVERDVKAIARDNNLPEPLRMAARRQMVKNESRRS